MLGVRSTVQLSAGVDPEARVLRGLARENLPTRTKRPADALQRLAGLAKQLTSARYGAVVVIDERDNVEGSFVSGLSKDQERRLKSAKTLLGVPLDVYGDLRGSLYVTDRGGGTRAVRPMRWSFRSWPGMPDASSAAPGTEAGS